MSKAYKLVEGGIAVNGPNAHPSYPILQELPDCYLVTYAPAGLRHTHQGGVTVIGKDNVEGAK